ncbi:MAG: Lrp/AsnC family leucine-responsive transcriptional regulator [Paracoccaceae bacterium]|jgi:Lrp/AsnC family leucine-responsive transcriptional regulator|tara:strand:- start:156 stop:635 length:480 start_codon:yes stop_codon:yes gene_type:complete
MKGYSNMINLDATDLRILRIIQKRGRISNSDLSTEINLSASACHRRVSRLEMNKVIKDYVALLDPIKVNLSTTVFVEITLNAQADEVLDKFEQEVKKIPNVLECNLMAGSADYLLKVIATDTDDFARLHRKFLASLPGVAQIQSSFSLKNVFKETGLPI